MSHFMSFFIILTDRMCAQLVLFFKVSVTIATMLNFDGDFDEHVDGDVMCKLTFIVESMEETSNRLVA